jgi:hypothetical protein
VADDLKKQLAKAIIDSVDQPKKTTGTIHFIVGNNNLQVNGDITISANQKTVKRVNHLPECDDLTAQQKRFIQEKINQLADRAITKGADIGKARTAWWSRLKKKYTVNSYTCLKQSQYDDVINRLDQQVGMTMSKLRRTDNKVWRNEYCKGLYVDINFAFLDHLNLCAKKRNSAQ